MDLGPFDPDLLLLVIIPIVVMIPIVAIAGAWTHRILKTRAEHQERIAMIEKGLDPDELAKQHKERLAMIEQGMHPDRPELEDGDLERDPELIER